MRAYSLTHRTARIAATAVIVAALLPGRVRAQEATAGPMSINTTSAGYLGILSLRCDCTLGTDPDVRNRFFVFRSDPVVTGIEAGSPAAGVIMRGDAITHIDGVSLRTIEGARRFASIQPGQKVDLTLRRGGRTSKAHLTAAALDWNDTRVLGNVAPEGARGYTMTWDYPSVPPASAVAPMVPPASAVAPMVPPTPSRPPVAARGSWTMVVPVQPGAGVWAPAVPSSPASPSGWFGFSIRCSNCEWAASNRPGESPVWDFESAPELSMVAGGGPAARAGLRPGDILTHIDGVSILTPAGAKKFGGVVPGQKVRVAVLRDGRSITRELTLTRRPEARAAEAAAGTTPRPSTPAARRELRYTGRLEDVTVEVWSTGGPTVERAGDTMVISVGGTVVRLKVEPKK